MALRDFSLNTECMAVYRLKATAIDDSDLRETILHERGYPYAWDGITIFRFTPE